MAGLLKKREINDSMKNDPDPPRGRPFGGSGVDHNGGMVASAPIFESDNLSFMVELFKNQDK